MTIDRPRVSRGKLFNRTCQASRYPGIAIAAIGLLALGTSSIWAAGGPINCTEASERLVSSLSRPDRDAIETTAFAYMHQYGCDDSEGDRIRRLASIRLTDLAMADARNGAAAEATLARLRTARRVSPAWPTLLALADTLFAGRDFDGAAKLYQQALDDMAEPHAGEGPAPDDRWAFALQRANETQMLSPDTLVPATRGGGPGGLDRALTGGHRAILVTPRFLPVTFLSNRAEMTDAGQSYAGRWVEAMRGADNLPVVIAGHADQRGTDAHNDKLSYRRARAVADFMKAHGFRGATVPLGFGRRCPVVFSDGANYSEEEKYRIARRVEVVVGTRLPAAYCHGERPTGSD